TIRRGIQSGDRNLDSPILHDFFDSYDELFSVINTINGAIDWANDKIPFLDISRISFRGLVEKADTQNTLLNQTTLNNMTFRVEDSNLELEIGTLNENGV